MKLFPFLQYSGFDERTDGIINFNYCFSLVIPTLTETFALNNEIKKLFRLTLLHMTLLIARKNLQHVHEKYAHLNASSRTTICLNNDVVRQFIVTNRRNLLISCNQVQISKKKVFYLKLSFSVLFLLLNWYAIPYYMMLTQLKITSFNYCLPSE